MMEIQTNKLSGQRSATTNNMLIHPDLRMDALLDITSGIALTLFGLLFLFSLSNDSSLLINIFFFIMLVTGLCISITKPMWYYRATWVFKHVEPIRTSIILKKSGCTKDADYYAELCAADLFPR